MRPELRSNLATVLAIGTVACASAPRPDVAATPPLVSDQAVQHETPPWTEPPAPDARWIEVVTEPAGAEIYSVDESAGMLAHTPWRTQVGYSREPELVLRMAGYQPVRVRVAQTDYRATSRIIVTLTPVPTR